MKVVIQVLFFFILFSGVVGCKKYNQVDNSGTVKTPYILYVGGYYGTLHKTNDALYFNTKFNTDGQTVRQILAADTMLLYMKENFYFSRNEGGAFQQSNDHPRNFEDLFYKYFLPNQALYDPIDTFLYLCTNAGLEKSIDKGETFTTETNWALPAILPNSITQLQNGDLYIIQDSNNIYKKTHIGAPPTNPWTAVPQTLPLPTDTPTWFITHKYNMLLAADFDGGAGIYNSIDGGSTWNACTGIPKGPKILFAGQALSNDNSFFAGLDSGGLWRLDGTNFIPSGQGIPWYAKVHYVVGKKVVYRTDVERYYHFCATDVGLFISENDGVDWRLLRAGAYSTLY